jgi:hypothetical protein
MQACPDFTIAYVITSDGRDVFGNMALVSMLTVRATNSQSRILLVCDALSMRALRSVRHRVLEVCDELVPVDTPPGEPTFRNRWIKTQLCRYVSGPCLYLDADMLVRGSLADLPSLAPELGVVANHNQDDLADQMWVEDAEFLRRMGWPGVFPFYANGGLQFYRQCTGTERFYEAWHRLWLDGVNATGRLRDQPSLNTAISESGVKASRLPEKFNLQLQAGHRGVSAALVWHFWAAAELQDSAFRRLLQTVPTANLGDLERRVRRVITRPYPYPNQDFLGRRIGRKIENDEEVATFEKLWLMSRRAAVRFWAGGVKARFARTRVVAGSP